MTFDQETGRLVPMEIRPSQEDLTERFGTAAENAVYFGDIYAGLVAKAREKGLDVKVKAAPGSSETSAAPQDPAVS